MDIKDLLNLAKDNQSYNQKKFDRDQVLKNKNKSNNDVSNSAVQSFLAKKQQAEQRAKAAEDAARKKRIEERLQASQGKKAPGVTNNPTKSDTTNKGISEKRNPKYEELRRQNLKHLKKPTLQEEQKKTRSEEQRKPQSNKTSRMMSKVRQKSTAKTSSSSIDFKQLMKVAKGQTEHKPDLQAKKDYKQHRRKKGTESGFEWSGSSNTLESRRGDAASKNAEREYQRKAEKSKDTAGLNFSETKRLKTSKKATSSISFKDLLTVAKTQANKPTSVSQKKEATIKPKASARQQAGVAEQIKPRQQAVSREPVKPRKQATAREQVTSSDRKISRRLPEVRRKNKCVDINSISMNKKAESSSKNTEKRPLSGGCKLVTRTIDNKRNYEIEKPRMGSHDHYGNRDRSNGVKRSKFESMDDELERERKELERKRNMLKRKMQGLPEEDEMSDLSEYSEDDYDDDMADFIDDGGEEADYSKHIRSIFGYDRRRFQDDDDDDLAAMESNYREIAAEESRSARIAKLEDEIERRREEMELRKAKKRR